MKLRTPDRGPVLPGGPYNTSSCSRSRRTPTSWRPAGLTTTSTASTPWLRWASRLSCLGPTWKGSGESGPHVPLQPSSENQQLSSYSRHCIMTLPSPVSLYRIPKPLKQWLMMCSSPRLEKEANHSPHFTDEESEAQDWNLGLLRAWHSCLSKPFGGASAFLKPTPVFLPGESQGWGEPGGLPSMGSHRVGHDWSDLAAGAAFLRPGWPWFTGRLGVPGAGTEAAQRDLCAFSGLRCRVCVPLTRRRRRWGAKSWKTWRLPSGHSLWGGAPSLTSSYVAPPAGPSVSGSLHRALLRPRPLGRLHSQHPLMLALSSFSCGLPFPPAPLPLRSWDASRRWACWGGEMNIGRWGKPPARTLRREEAHQGGESGWEIL